MQMHESVREEVGWITILVGVVALLLGLIDLWLAGTGASVLSSGWDWALILIGIVVTLLGLYLHVTRSRQRTTDVSATGTPTTGQMEKADSPEGPTREQEQGKTQ